METAGEKRRRERPKVMSDKLEGTYSALGLFVGTNPPRGRVGVTAPDALPLANELIATVNAYITRHPSTTRQQVHNALRTAAARVAEPPPG